MKKKRVRVTLRVTADEKAKIKRAATSCGMTINQFVVDALLYRAPGAGDPRFA